ncbi:hypothetical protein [Marinobacter sp. C2H3]|uniref:hypothetical protein n=1 Tax=Marinobacter sp. C2H3 TaxID=3119003 RepID=UPI00300EDD20
MTQIDRSRRWLLAALTLAGLAGAGTAAAAPCDPASHGWLPSRYYGQGAVVYHNGQWYRSREFQEGRTPGAAFEWQALDTVPSCDEPVTRSPANQAADSNAPGVADKHPPSNADTGKGHGQENGSSAHGRDNQPAARPCPEAPEWSFAVSYTVGTRVQYKGQTWRAIRPSNGSMPGVGMPPAWEAAPGNCGR